MKITSKLLRPESAQSANLMRLKDRLWRLTAPLSRIIARIPDIRGILLSRARLERVLDIGCGCGSYTPYLKKVASNVIGLDVNPGFIQYAKNHAPSDGYVLADCKTLPFRDNSFDVALMIMLLHHLPSYNSTLESLHEALRVSRDIIILDYSISSSSVRILEKMWLRLHDGAINLISAKDWRDAAGRIRATLLGYYPSTPLEYFCLVHYTRRYCWV